MGRIPQDPAAREAWLRRWASEQREQVEEPTERHRRLPARFAQRLELEAERIEWYLDRGLDTGVHRYDTPELAAVDGVVYIPTPWHVLPRALRALHASESDVLADLGCGKGRIVHQAARRGLRRVIGVEISPELADFARRLVAAHRSEYRCQDVEIIVGDAARYEVPHDVTIVFMFDPFRGRTFDDALGRLVKSIDEHPRRVRLIYVNPCHGDRVLATGRFRLLKWQRGGLRDVRIFRAALFESC